MAYRCPVCDNPEIDAEHLANHLAFTAVIRGDDHEDWLDEHVPGWDEEGPETLAPKVDEAVPEVEVPELDDDGGHDHGGRLEDELAQQGSHRGPGAAGGSGEASGADGASAGGRGDLTDEAAGVMAQAQELTREMYDLDDEDADDADDASDADDAEADDVEADDVEADDAEADDAEADDADVESESQ